MSNNRTVLAAFGSEVEGALLAIVRETLHNETIEPEDDFFLAGGHSLLGTQLVIRVRKAFDVKLTLNDLFEAGTVAQLAVRIEELIVGDVDALSDADVLYANS